MPDTSTNVTHAQLTHLPAWQALAEHFEHIKDVHLRQLFADDPRRGERLSAEAVGLYLDYSKHRITDETLRLLVRLAAARGLRARIDAMYSGEKINLSEGRAVLPTALRAPRAAPILVDAHHLPPHAHPLLTPPPSLTD